MNTNPPTPSGPCRILLLSPVFLLVQTPLATMPDGHPQTTQWVTRLLWCAQIWCSTREPAEHDHTQDQSDRVQPEYHKVT